jgi:hypothetical protein
MEIPEDYAVMYSPRSKGWRGYISMLPGWVWHYWVLLEFLVVHGFTIMVCPFLVHVGFLNWSKFFCFGLTDCWSIIAYQ